MYSGSMDMKSAENGMEWNFSSTIRREKETTTPPSPRSPGGEEEEDTRRHTLTGPVELEVEQPIRTEIDDTAFVAVGDRSSVVVGERESSASGEEGEGREGGEGGKGCVLQEPERTRGDGQEADGWLVTPPSSSLQHIILPLLTQVIM